MNALLAPYREAIAGMAAVQRIGHVRRLGGLCVEVQGLNASVGELCAILPPGGKQQPGTKPVIAEVVGVRTDGLSLMPYGPVQGLAVGCEVRAHGIQSKLPVGTALIGRVIDGFGEPLDGKPAPVTDTCRELRGMPINPMLRPRVDTVLETGVRAIDALLTLGRGQRVGIFAGSGVGKSTLLGMVARHVNADINVIALIGERGREVKEFVDKQLGPQGLARSVVVVAASDQPALARLRATYAALAIAEYFRDRGQHVVLTMDSITRFAMAKREVGLAAGEPPTARGYTPSVFAELPELCERCGTGPTGGSITALMTVLVEGDDLNEPIADNMRAILDGHIVLSRQLAQNGQYPAIDVLQSASRVMPDIIASGERELAAVALRTAAVLERNRQLVDIGAYTPGSNPELDLALSVKTPLLDWLGQRDGVVPRSQACAKLASILKPVTAARAS